MSRQRLAAAALALSIIFLSPSTAQGWNREGHMVTGAVAYSHLRAIDPVALETVLDLLREHPHHETMLQGPDDWARAVDDRDMAVFMQAARWADDVRSGRYEAFGRSNWHYVNYHLRDGRLDPPGDPERDGFLLQALHDNRMRATQGDPSDRAIALTWLFHLVGDSHQPLHTIANHAPQHPDGDRGGNRFYIRVEPGADTINLHWLWDDLVIGTPRFTEVRNRATELRNQPGLTAEDFGARVEDLDFDAWVREGAELAVEHVYRGGAIVSGTRENGTLLPANYIESVQPIARERAALAGYRLAQLLAELF